MRITLRFTIVIVCISTCCMILFGSYQYLSREAKARQQLDTELATELETLRVAIAGPQFNYDESTVDAILEAVMANKTLLAVTVYDVSKGGNTLFSGRYRDVNGRVVAGTRKIVAGPLVRTTEVMNKGTVIGQVTVEVTGAFLQTELNQLLLGEVFRLLVLNLMLILIILAIAQYTLLRPILELTDAARDIAEGDLTRRISVSSDNEIGQLAESLEVMKDSMLHQLESLEQQNLELARSRSNLSITLDSIGDGVIVTDAAGLIVRMNPIAEILTGWPLSIAIGQALEQVYRIIDSETRSVCQSPATLATELNGSVEQSKNLLLVGRDHSECRISTNSAPIVDNSGDSIGVIIVFRDITKEYALEDQLRQSQKLEAIGQLAGGVAHDLNNMLGGIVGAAEMLTFVLPEDSKGFKYQKVILGAAARASSLTKGLLTFSRHSPAMVIEVEAHKILGDLQALLENIVDKQIRLSVELDAVDHVIMGDPAQLQSAFLNLIINATHAMPDGGDLRIHSAAIRLDEDYCQSSPFDLKPGRYLEVEVADNGCGIDPKLQSRIFEPFFTTKVSGEGTGLGLAAVYGIVKQHRGAINVVSALGEGTLMQVLLPLTEESAQLAQPDEQAQQGSGCILVVDDEEIMRTTVKALLESLGYDVLLARDGEQALSVYRVQQERIDLVLLDMLMPVMNGQKCFTALKALKKDIKVVVATGFSHEQSLEEMTRDGLLGVIRKPYRRNELSHLLHKVLCVA